MRAGPFVPPVVWMGVIFWLSTPSFAAEETGGWILPLLKALLPWATLPQLEFIHWLGRKMAHVTEYAILAWLWHRALSRPGRGPRSLAAFALTVAYAITDELHQGWTGSRGASALDV
ncbi:MAG: VanZ family protein, partial [Candidatus Rokuibacteriota bacterium]